MIFLPNGKKYMGRKKVKFPYHSVFRELYNAQQNKLDVVWLF